MSDETKTLTTTVMVDADELREWAGKHADAGHHGVAHVLFLAAEGVESVAEQHIREARAAGWDEGHRVGWQHCQDGDYGNDHWDDDTPNPYRRAASKP